MKKHAWLICLFLLFFSCKSDKEKNIKIVTNDDFTMKKQIYGEVILKDAYFKNYDIQVFDTILVVETVDASNFYNIYNKNSLEYLGAIGVRGEGPNEWKTIYNSGQFEKTDSGICLWMHRYQKGFLSKINITKTLNSKSPYPVIEETIKVDANVFPFYKLFTLNNHKLIGNCWIEEAGQVRIKSFNTKTKKVKKSQLFPQIKNYKHLPVQVINSLYTADFKKHPSKNLFVQSMVIFNRIDVFDEELNRKFSIVDGKNWKNNYYDGLKIDPAANFLKDKLKGYAKSCVTDNYMLFIDMKKKRSNVDNSVKESYIKVFNWGGKPICLLKSSDDIFSISLDEKEGILYATDVSNDKILRYDIKKIMKKW